MLSWLSEIGDCPPLFKKNLFFIKFIDKLRKQYGKNNDSRLPFTLKHILEYTIHKKAIPNNYWKVNIDSLLEILILQLYFFTMSRKNELLHNPRSLNISKNIGLKFHQLKWLNHSNSINNYVDIKIQFYKNKIHHKKPKIIHLGNTHCINKNKCICNYLNPYKLLHLYIIRRKKLFNNIHNLYKSQNIIMPNKFRKLQCKKSNHIFVNKNGTVLTVKFISDLAKKVIKLQNIPDSHRYSAYNIRIGGTSTASAANVNHTKILRYVLWTDNRLLNIAMRYIRFSASQLKCVPFEMIHGSINKSFKLKNTNQNMVYDPWKNDSFKKIFGI